MAGCVPAGTCPAMPGQGNGKREGIDKVMADNIVRGITITSLERLRLSVNGNPRFRVTFDNGLTAQTQSDAGFAYAIENPEYRDVPLDVTLTRAGRISHIARSDGTRG